MIRLFARVGPLIVLGAFAAACGGADPSGETAVTAAPAGALEWSGPVPAESVPVAEGPAGVVSVPETGPAEAVERAVAVPGVSSGGLLSVVIPRVRLSTVWTVIRVRLSYHRAFIPAG